MFRRCRFDEEDSKDVFLSAVGKIDGVLEAEEKRGRSYLAALLVNARPNQFVKDLICTVEYLLPGDSKCSWRFALCQYLTPKIHPTLRPIYLTVYFRDLNGKAKRCQPGLSCDRRSQSVYLIF